MSVTNAYEGRSVQSEDGVGEQEVAGARAETRSPKAETRKKSEIRNPNLAELPRAEKWWQKDRQRQAAPVRPSDFGLLSDFGLRPSDLEAPAQRLT